MEKLFWPALNLFVLLGFLTYKTRKPFFTFVRTRRLEIFEGLNRSEQQVKEATKRRAEVEAKIASLGVETATIASEWDQKAKSQAAVIRESSARVLSQMKIEAEQNKRALVEQTGLLIRASFKKSLLQSAEQKIVQSLNSSVHAKVNERLTGEVNRGMTLS